MAIAHIGILLYINAAALIFVYLHAFKFRKLVGFQLGMNIAMIAGGIFGLATGVLLIYAHPLQFALMTCIAAVAGMVVGGLFGALFDYQTALTGYANGLMLGIMAPMVGAAAKFNQSFILFIEILLAVALILIVTAVRRT